MKKHLLFVFMLSVMFSLNGWSQTIVFEQDFSSGFGDFTNFSVSGDQTWEIEEEYGNNAPCAKMSGYNGAPNENEDWLFTPAFNLTNVENPVFSFDNATKYDGNAIELYISSDYNGGDPNSATWESLNFTASPGNFTWTFSGDIDLSSYSGTNVYIGFKYTSTSEASSTWEIDNVKLAAGSNPPPGGDAIFELDFTNGFGDWTTVSVTGDQEWSIVSYGNPGDCAKMSGWDGSASNENEDWLISPAYNADNYSGEVLIFDNSTKYDGNPLELYISTDYTSGNPNDATWESLSFTASPGNFTWTSSGDIDLSAYTGENVHIAFKYTSTAEQSATWQVDNIQLLGDPNAITEQSTEAFSVYPNPSKGVFNIRNTSGEEIHISVYNILGSKVYDAVSSSALSRVELDVLPGTYFIQLKNESATVIHSQRLIVR